jgi:outer membrane protein assembly factor BamB
VSSFNSDQVLRYGADGAFDGVAVAAGAGGLDGPDIGLTFDGDGALLVPSWYSDQVLRFDAATGALLGEVLGPDDGLARPRGIVVADDGGMWVSGWASGVHRVAPDGTVTLLVAGAAAGMVHDGAALLVATDEELVRAFDPATGADLGVRAQRPLIDGITAVGLLSLP